jgi:hypothetical protein
MVGIVLSVEACSKVVGKVRRKLEHDFNYGIEGRTVSWPRVHPYLDLIDMRRGVS